MASTTLAQGSNPGLTTNMSIFYDKVFLERALLELRHDFGATVKNVPLNAGTTVYWNRFTPLAVSTTALSEASNPTAVDMTSTLVSAVLADYGGYTVVGSLYSMTSIDENLKEHVSTYGQLAGETIDTIIRNVMFSGATAQLVSTATAASTYSNVHTSDVMTGLEIRKAVRTLKVNKAPKFEGGLYRGIIGPYVAMDLLGNSEWLDSVRYTTSDQIKNGVIGKIHGVEFVESNNAYYTASAGFSSSVNTVAAVFDTFVFGKGAYGTVSLGNTTAPKIYVKNPGANSTDNPIDQFSTVGWKMPFAAAVLNSNWLISIKTGATGANL